MKYNQVEFTNEQIVSVTGINVIGENVVHIIIDGVVYMFQSEDYDNYHSHVNEWICEAFDVLPVMQNVNFKAVVKVVDWDMGGYGDSTNTTFTQIHGEKMIFGMSSGNCECCGDMDGSIWFGDYFFNSSKKEIK